MKNLLLFLFAAAALSVSASVSIKKLPEDSNGHRTIVLENSLIKAGFSTLGGRLVLLTDKSSGKNLTCDTGCKDFFMFRGFEHSNIRYDIDTLVNTPEKAVLRLRSQSVTGSFQFIKVTRTVTLKKDESVIHTDLEIHNQTESMTSHTLQYWFHAFLGVPGVTNLYHAMAADGVKRFTPADKTNKVLVKPVRGWIAMSSVKGGGVALMPEYKRFDYSYTWCCRPKLAQDTLEFLYIPEKVDCGRTLKSFFDIGIFRELVNIDGSSPSGCGELKYDGKNLEVKITGFRKFSAPLEIFVNGKKIAGKKISVLPGKVTSVHFPLQAGKSYIITAKAGDLELNKVKNRTLAPQCKQLVSDFNTDDWQIKWSDKVKTPSFSWHKAWNKKFLFLLPAIGMRDVLELKQRSGFVADIPTIFPHDWQLSWRVQADLYTGEKLGVKFLPVFVRGKKYDMIVLGSNTNGPLKWGQFPAEFRKDLLERVKKGTPMLLINPDTKEKELASLRAALKEITKEFTASADLSCAPLLPKTRVFAGTYGKGKVMILNYPAVAFLAPKMRDRSAVQQLNITTHRFQEYQFAFVLKAMRELLGEKKEIISLKSSGDTLLLNAARNGQGEVEIFNAWSESIGKKKISFKQGNNNIALSLPGDGTFYIHLKSGNDFGFVRTVKKSPLRITEIKMADWFPGGKAVAGEVKVTGLQKNDKVLVEITDNTGRKLFAAEGTEFAYQPIHARVIRHILRAAVVRQGKVVTEARKAFYLPDVPKVKNDFLVTMWTNNGYVPDYTVPYRYELLRQMGVNVMLSPGGDTAVRTMQYGNLAAGPIWIASSSMFYNRYIERSLDKYYKTLDKKFLVKPNCTNNPATKVVAKIPEIFRMYGCRDLALLGDEMSIGFYSSPVEVCYCPFCLKKFRLWLKERYKSLADLNKSWRCSFKTWDDVIPMTYGEMMLHNSPAPWVEHRLFMDKTFSDGLLRVARDGNRQYPGTIIGPGGIEVSPAAYGGGRNIWNMSKQASFLHYGTPRIGASFNRNRFLSVYLGYSMGEGYLRYRIWDALFVGCRGLSFWYEPIFVLPDLRFSPLREFLIPLLWEIREKEGELLNRAEKITDQVAILHSHESFLANYMKQRKADFFKKEMSFAYALEDMGIPHRFIAPEQIGELDKFKALILPECSALSDKVVAAIRSFAARGGIVIADYDPASCDDKCVKRSKPALDDLFGIRRSLRTSLRNVKEHNVPGVTVNQAIRGIRIADGKALYKAGTFPLVIVKGKCAMLNFVPEYEQYREAGFRTLLKKLLPGVEPAVKLESPKSVMQHFYKHRDRLYITMLPEALPGSDKFTLKKMAESNFKATVTLPRDGHFYDTRAGKYLGYGKRFNVTLTPGEGAFFTVMPEKLSQLKLSGKTSARQGESVKIKAAATKGHQVYALRVFDPSGKDVMEYRKVLNVTGTGEFTIPFALNDPCGLWRAVVTDAATGVASELKINVKEK